jgi:hypothetical protein
MNLEEIVNHLDVLDPTQNWKQSFDQLANKLDLSTVLKQMNQDFFEIEISGTSSKPLSEALKPWLSLVLETIQAEKTPESRLLQYLILQKLNQREKTWPNSKEWTVELGYIHLISGLDQKSIKLYENLESSSSKSCLILMKPLSFQDKRIALQLLTDLTRMGSGIKESLDSLLSEMWSDWQEENWTKKRAGQVLEAMMVLRYPKRTKREQQFQEWKKQLQSEGVKAVKLQAPRDFEGQKLGVEFQIKTKDDLKQAQTELEILANNYEEFERILFKTD